MSNTTTKALSKDQYHAMHDHVSASMLKQLRRDVTVFHDTFVETDPAKKRPPFVETKPMETGSILHALALDRLPIRSVCGIYPEHNPDYSEIRKLTGPKRDALSDDQKKRYAKICGVSLEDFTTAKGGAPLKAITSSCPENVIGSTGVLSKKAAAEFRQANSEYRYFLKRNVETNAGKTGSYEAIREAFTAIRNSKYYQLLEADAVIRETPLFWECIHTGLKCRCCPDFMMIDEEYKTAWVWDLKITEFATNFEKQMNNLDYHIQQEHYTAGVLANYPQVEKVVYAFVACKPTYPYHVVDWRFGEDDRDSIHDDYVGTMKYLAQLHESNDWSHPLTIDTQTASLWRSTRKFV